MTAILRPPPHDHDNERQLIGSLLTTPGEIAEAAGIVRAEDFHAEQHRATFAALVRLGMSADVMTVRDAMTRAGAKDAPTEGELAGMMAEAVYVGNWEHHARAIADNATRRRLIDACGTVARAAFDPTTPAAEVLSMAAQEMTRAGDGVARDRPNLQQIAADYMARREVEIAADGQPTGIPSGLADLDRITNGWRPGQLVTIAGPTGSGKSTLMLQCALHAAQTGRRVLILTLEMEEVEIMAKLVACCGRVNNTHGARPNMDRETRATNTITRLPLAIRYTPGATVGEVMTECHREKSTHEALDLVVVDYVQIMGTPQERGQTRAAAIGAITRELKTLAGKLGAAILLGSQLNREGSAFESGPPPVPQLHHMRESGSIEQDSSVVLMLHDPQEKTNPDLRALWVRKQRSGPKNVNVDLFAKFGYSRFEEGETVPLEALV